MRIAETLLWNSQPCLRIHIHQVPNRKRGQLSGASVSCARVSVCTCAFVHKRCDWNMDGNEEIQACLSEDLVASVAAQELK
jgi:hypothetical protein